MIGLITMLEVVTVMDAPEWRAHRAPELPRIRPPAALASSSTLCDGKLRRHCSAAEFVSLRWSDVTCALRQLCWPLVDARSSTAVIGWCWARKQLRRVVVLQCFRDHRDRDRAASRPHLPRPALDKLCGSCMLLDLPSIDSWRLILHAARDQACCGQSHRSPA